MFKRVLGLVGWLGVALVGAALAISQLKPEWQWFRTLAMAGLACTLLYILSQWRDVARSFSGRNARLGSLAAASVVVVLGILVAINYLRQAAQQAMGLDSRTAVLVVRPDEEGAARAAAADAHPRLRQARGVQPLSRTARRVSVREQTGECRVHRSRPASHAREPGQGRADGDGRARLRRPNRAGHVRYRTGPDQRPDQSHSGQAEQAVLRPGPRRTFDGRFRTDRLQHDCGPARLRKLRHRQARAGATAADSRRCHGPGRRRAQGRFLSRRDRGAEGVPGKGRKSPLPARSARTRRLTPTAPISWRC